MPCPKLAPFLFQRVAARPRRATTTEGPAMQTLLSTDAVQRSQRLAYWTDMICNVYVQLGCDPVRPDDAGDFNGHIRQHTLPGLDVSVVTSGPQSVTRTPSHIARASDDYFLVSIQARGRGIVRQDGRDAVLAAGDFALYDSTRPYQLLFEDAFEQIVLKLPGERLRSELRDTEALTATRVSGSEGAGHLLLSMLRTLREDIDTLQPASALAVANGVQSILVAGLQTLPALRSPAVSNLTAYHWRASSAESTSSSAIRGCRSAAWRRNWACPRARSIASSRPSRLPCRATSGSAGSTPAAATCWNRVWPAARWPRSHTAVASTTRRISAAPSATASAARRASGGSRVGIKLSSGRDEGR
jgi:hypothetical protein